MGKILFRLPGVATLYHSSFDGEVQGYSGCGPASPGFGNSNAGGDSICKRNFFVLLNKPTTTYIIT